VPTSTSQLNGWLATPSKLLSLGWGFNLTQSMGERVNWVAGIYKEE
jgi:hypothetical protein